MKKHTIDLTDDQLTVVIGLMHAGAAALSGDAECLLTSLQLLAEVKDDEKRAEEAQAILLAASDPEAWYHTMNVVVAQQRRN